MKNKKLSVRDATVLELHVMHPEHTADDLDSILRDNGIETTPEQFTAINDFVEYYMNLAFKAGKRYKAKGKRSN